ncbi:MAG: AsmA family protein [Burkholderiales bacterium]
MVRIPNALKIFLFALGGLVGIVLLAALAVMLLVNSDAYKPRAEAAASDALGMNVTVEGRLRIGVVPGLHVTLENVRIRNRGTEIALVKEAELAIEPLSLLQQELRYRSVVLNGVRISIERGRDGTYNYEKLPEAKEETFHALDLQRVSFGGLIVAYADKKTGASFESSGCSGELTDMRHPGGAAFLSRVSLSGEFACSEVRGKNTTVSDLKFSVEATEGVFNFTPVTMRVFGGQGSGSMRMDRSAAVPIVHVSYSLSKFRVEDFFKALAPGRSVHGLMDFSTTLSMRGRTRVELRQSANGEMSLSGMNLTLAGADLDKELLNYESSLSFNLVDMSAFLFAGPIGLAATKGYEFARLGQQSGGSTQIRTVVSKWKVEKGVAYAKDVAMATRENRLALQGGLDFVNDEYDDVVVALIDSNGCAKVRQKIRGSFSKPVVEKLGVLASLAGPVLRLLSKARALLPGTRERCEVFYSGSVAPPK